MLPLLGRNRDVTGATSHTANEFAVFFTRKIERVRFDTGGLPPLPINSARSSFTSFRLSSQEEVRKIIMPSLMSCLWTTYLLSYYGIHRCTSAIRHSDNERVSSTRSAARLTESCNCHAASKETRPRHRRHAQLSPGV